MGGNQGFSTNPSPYDGRTEINISGGKVTNVYGAGTGRETSIPRFAGQLAINVSGSADVGTIYGASSAAYVAPGAGGAASSASITVTVPADLEAGATSRLLVTLGGQQVPYHLIAAPAQA